MRSFRAVIGIITLAVIAALFVCFYTVCHGNYLTLTLLKQNRAQLQQFVANHYWKSVFCFMVVYLGTVIMSLPIATLMTVAGGMLFGLWYGTLFSLIGGTIGSIIAFFGIRYVVGDWLASRYTSQLKVLNEQMRVYGSLYLLGLHFIIFIPFTLINLLAGLTNVSWTTFLWTTVVGMLPASIIYAFAGQKLATIDSLSDLFSVRGVLGLSAIATLLLISLVVSSMHRSKRSRRL